MTVADQVRIDKWLWAVRLFKTRSAANDACSSGRVRVGGSPAKPAHRVKVGDRVAIRTRGVTRTYRVDRLIEKRVGILTTWLQRATSSGDSPPRSGPST